MPRSEWELVPEYGAEIEEIRKNGLSLSLLYNILQKHTANAEYNRQLYKRFMVLKSGVPIFERQPRYKKENPINNKVNNDYFGLIVKAKVGCFAGNPIAYSYSDATEAEETTGSEQAVELAKKALTDFITRNTMESVDMEVTKNAAIYGYSGRLLYVKDGVERVKPVHGFETIILSETDISEPEYAIRYSKSYDIDKRESWTVEFYDSKNVTIYKGDSLYSLTQTDVKEHLFDYCPLQGVANNEECLGDAESVLPLIDEYDKSVSDNSNELENFAHALLLVTILGDPKTVRQEIQKANDNGVLHITPTGSTQINDPVKWLTKQINDAFNEHHLERMENNIYMFSQTPKFNDESFGNASGVALQHKFNGMREKCSTFKNSMMKSSRYMWKVFASSLKKKGIAFDDLQVVMDVTPNLPHDTKTEAETVQGLINAGLPKRYAYTKLSDVDDIEYIMQLIAEQKEEETDVTSLYEDDGIDDDTAKGTDNKATDDELDGAKSGGGKTQLA